MEYKKTLNQIKALLSMEVKLMENKLDNGTMVWAESWEVGFPVFVLSDDGTQIPIPEGEYTLEDGTMFSVDAEGVLLSYGSAEEPVEEEQEMEAETPAKKVVESTTKETHFNEDEKVEEKVEVLFSDEQKTALSEMIAEGIKSYFEALKETPVMTAEEIKNAPVVDLTEETELKKEELSEQVKPIKHSPEKEVGKTQKFLYSQKRKKGTKDRVFEKLFN